jgi:hypothetical protein
MRIFFLVALVCFVISLICSGVGITIFTLSWAFWAVAGLLAWLLDGAPTLTFNNRRPN